MTTITVWAPKPHQVQLHLNGKTLPMIKTGGGWWQAEVDVPPDSDGCEYGFVLDGEGPFPDPCSPWQPDGVEGLSRTVDHNAFPWTDAGFQQLPLASAVIYEMHVGTFTQEGTFESAISKLDYLVDLGITHMQLMPVSQFPGARGWGYDGVNLYAPHNAYGGPEGLKTLVDACHARGLAVILDVVYNHFGPSGNYITLFGPYQSEQHLTAWGQAMNLDGPGSDGVRRFFVENALSWLRDYHFDGLRLDAIHALVDNSATHFLEELASEVHRLSVDLGRHLNLIAESELNDPRIVNPQLAGGYGVDAQWSDDFHHALHVLLTGEQTGYYADYSLWDSLEKAFTRVFVYDGAYSPLRDRRHGRRIRDSGGFRFLGYLQNHDQVGNRARGDRISHVIGPELAKIGAALVLLSPFVPMLFMGEEWAASTPFQYFTNHPDSELGKAVTKGRRKEFEGFGWKPEDVPDPQAEETFLASRLNWDELEGQPHADVLEWYRKLIVLRKQYRAELCYAELFEGRLQGVELHTNRDGGWLVLRRGKIHAAANLNDLPSRVPWRPAQRSKTLLASHPEAHIEGVDVVLPPRSILIFVCDDQSG